jgi:phosphoribosylanthranilate isomerase
MWVKVCANTSLEDAQHAIRSGADAVGFVFAAESKRRVSPQQVAAITSQLPMTAEKFGVFLEQGIEEIAEIVRAAGLTGAQMHSANVESAERDAALLREGVGNRSQRFSVVQVVHFNPAEMKSLDEKIAVLSRSRAIDAVLVDSRTKDAVGGTGIAYDWLLAQRSFFQAASGTRLIVAGGLTPQNVRNAILTLTPWGVDVATGVEATAGKKDPLKVDLFISTAREAGAEVNKTRAAARE